MIARGITLFTLMLVINLSWAQTDQIEVELTIQQKVKDQITTFPHAPLRISNQGDIKTDEHGQYFFHVPVSGDRDPVVGIEVLSDMHELLKPVDGAVELSATESKIKIDFLVVDMSTQDEEFKERIRGLENRVKSLKSQNHLTKRQLNKLNETLVDTILFFEANRARLENQIQNYQDVTEQQSEEIQSLRDQIYELEGQVDQLTVELEEAMEERYLRQNEYYKSISSSFLAYLRKAKDLRDHLPYISTYYNSPSGFQNYDKDIRSYNDVWEALDNSRFDYLEGVERYWNNPALSSELEELYSFLLKGIHQSQVLRTVNEINVELHKQKPKKAQKIASLSHEDMAINIRTLERQINRLLTQMRRIT